MIELVSFAVFIALPAQLVIRGNDIIPIVVKVVHMSHNVDIESEQTGGHGINKLNAGHLEILRLEYNDSQLAGCWHIAQREANVSEFIFLFVSNSLP